MFLSGLNLFMAHNFAMNPKSTLLQRSCQNLR